MGKIVSVNFIRSEKLSKEFKKDNDIPEDYNGMVEMNIQNSIPTVNYLTVNSISGKIREQIKKDGLILNKKKD